MLCDPPLSLLSHLQVEMSVLPHGAEPVTRQADLLLILHALVTSQDLVGGAGCVSRTERSGPPLFSFPRPPGLSSCYCKQVLPPSAPLDRLGLAWSPVPLLTIPYMQSSGNGPSVVELGEGGVSVKKLVGGKLICECLQNNLFNLYLIVFFSWLFKLDDCFFLAFFSCLGQKDSLLKAG